jgi:hypothetical protein
MRGLVSFPLVFFPRELSDADTMLAAGGKYTGDNTQIERGLSMIILYGLDFWATWSPLLTPRWQQAVTSLKRFLRRMGALQ